MPSAQLPDRGIVHIGGAEARAFLDGILTCDMDGVAPGRARFGALLTAQGKILFDFVVFADGADGFMLDCRRVFAPDLVQRLSFYRLRAKVTLEDRSEALAVVAGWDGAPEPAGDSVLGSAPDPRLPALGWRALAPIDGAPALTDATPEDYDAHRIALGVPDGGRDFLYGDAFPHEALMDQLGGVDFDKGCYVGQEVVSRMQHRGTARTRIVPLVYLDGFVAEAGTEVAAGGRALGTTGTASRGRGLAMVRVDRAADALAAGLPITAGGLPVRLEKPGWVRFPFPGEASAPAA